jgi:spore coat protein JB
MCENQKKLLEEIRCAQFACIDIKLFLDTNPCNAAALADFNTCSCHLRKLMDRYCCEYGPLVGFGLQPAGQSWTWGQSPWPWEMC